MIMLPTETSISIHALSDYSFSDSFIQSSDIYFRPDLLRLKNELAHIHSKKEEVQKVPIHSWL